MYPAVLNNKYIKNPSSVGIIPTCYDGGQKKSGVDIAPGEMLKAGLATQIEKMGYSVNVLPDEDCESHKPESEISVEGSNVLNLVWTSNVCKAHAARVEEQCRLGNFALSLGGDHSLALGTITGSSRVYGEDLCIIWVDAHTDINTLSTTDSGNLHGCPVSFLLGIETHPELAWMKPIIRKDRFVYIGLRDIEHKERKIVKDNNIKAFTMHHVDKYGIGAVVQMAIDHINPNLDLPIHLSLDVDAMDPSVAPATGTPVRGGLTFRECHYLCEAIAETNCLVAMDLVEVNPLLGDESAFNQTVAVGNSVIRCALGETLL
ncbi:Arginase [Smittium mucronatum]|uniref:Arginase n=1 Tax=Smittium mucronatum TaxID=133383 RepID=A0A1R0GTL0_9FUNG|nr:Arginase [Smittium mucronatum]